MLRLVLVKSQTRFSFPESSLMTTANFLVLPVPYLSLFFFRFSHSLCYSAHLTAALSLSPVTRRGWLRYTSTPNRMWCSCCSETRQGVTRNEMSSALILQLCSLKQYLQTESVMNWWDMLTTIFCISHFTDESHEEITQSLLSRMQKSVRHKSVSLTGLPQTYSVI